jgi:hypothetical protein
MFDRLLESGRQSRRPAWQTGTSIGLHALIITGAVWATRRPVELSIAKVVTPAVIYVPDTHPPDADRSQPIEPVAMVAPAPSIPAIVNVPLHIPPLSSTDAPFDPSDYTGHGLKGDVLTGIGIAPDSIGARSIVITSAEADEVPSLLRSGPLTPPPGMAGVVARVELQFIIGTDGRVEPASVTVLGHTSAVFDESAKHMVTGSVYRPGRRNGATIRVLVRQGVSFKDAGS